MGRTIGTKLAPPAILVSARLGGRCPLVGVSSSVSARLYQFGRCQLVGAPARQPDRCQLDRWHVDSSVGVSSAGVSTARRQFDSSAGVSSSVRQLVSPVGVSTGASSTGAPTSMHGQDRSHQRSPAIGVSPAA
jgi:hypothetical protein